MKKLFTIFAASFVLLMGVQAQDMRKDTRGSEDAAAGGAMMSIDPSKAVFDLTGMAPGVVPFSSEAAAQAAASRKRVVYFFAASWCPPCRETYRDLKANAKSVPSDLTIVVVDYDKAPQLKAKYGVSSQHTYVSIGPQGEKLKIWSGSKKLDDIARSAIR